MQMRHFAATLILTALGAGYVGLAGGQEFPNRPMRIITSALGGGSDFTSRLVAQGISGPLGQPVLVENRSGVIPGEMVSQAPPDGHTLLVAAGTLWIGPLLQQSPYDPVRDFLPISLLARAPNVMVVHPSVPAKSVKDVIALAKAKSLNASSGGTGGGSHLAIELFNAMAGVKIVRIAYKNGAQEIADLIGGQVHMTFGAPAPLMPHVKAGKLRAIAITSPQPSALIPDLPTIAAAGLPGYEMVSLTGLFAPAKTPDPIIRRINQEVVRFLQTADAKEKLLSSGVEAVGSAPAELGAIVKNEMARLGKVITEAGIRLD